MGFSPFLRMAKHTQGELDSPAGLPGARKYNDGEIEYLIEAFRILRAKLNLREPNCIGKGDSMICKLLSVILLILIALPVHAELPTLIPRNVIFGNPVKTSPEISPDGKFLSYLAPDEKNVLQVWVQTLGKDDARKVTADKKRGIRFHMWTHAPGILIYAQD